MTQRRHGLTVRLDLSALQRHMITLLELRLMTTPLPGRPQSALQRVRVTVQGQALLTQP